MIHMIALLAVGLVLCLIFDCVLGRLSKVLKELKHINKKLDSILAGQNPVDPAVSLEILVIEDDGTTTRMDGMNLKKEKKREMVIVAKTKGGKETRLDGEVALTLPEGLEVVEMDGKKFIQAKDDAAEGAVLVMADADGDLGEGVKPLHYEAAVNIVAADAETLELVFGEEVDI